MIQAVKDIQTLYAAANYSDAVDLIVQLQTLLAASTTPNNLTNTLVLNSSGDAFTFTITGSLPNVTYYSWLDQLTNTLTGDVYDFSPDTFPATHTDTVKVITSSTAFNSTLYSDAVYQGYASFIDQGTGETYQALGYCLNITNINCAILQLIDKNPNCVTLQNQIDNLLFLCDEINRTFAALQYDECNRLIRKATQIITANGCKCGCFQL